MNLDRMKYVAYYFYPGAQVSQQLCNGGIQQSGSDASQLVALDSQKFQSAYGTQLWWQRL